MKLTDEQELNFLEYCSNSINHAEERLEYAHRKMEDFRCPLSHADPALYNDIYDALRDWCFENGLEGMEDEIDIESFF